MTRVRLALAAVIVTALVPALGVFVTVATNPRILRWQDDETSRFERRLAPLRDALRGEREVGYLPPQAEFRGHLYTVRYALAPVQVVEDSTLPLVIADNVADPRTLPAHLRLRRDFGQGLLLLESVPK